jgi:hypothetical protein
MCVPALFTSPLIAQTQFLRPARAVDLTQYTTVEACAALTERIRDSILRHDPLSTTVDTFPLKFANIVRRTPFPAVLTTPAKQCAAQFSAEQVPIHDFELLLPLFLLAGRDADAERLVSRSLAELAPFNGTATDQRRMLWIQSIVSQFYLEARPARYDMALRLLMAELQRELMSPIHRFSLLTRAADVATLMDDTLRAAQLTSRALEAYRQAVAQPGGEEAMARLLPTQMVLGRLTRLELLDSLRRGVSAYVALRRSDSRFAALGGGPTSFALAAPSLGLVGDRATPLAGDFWFTSDGGGDAKRAVRPSPGKISLVIFLAPYCPQGKFSPKCGSAPYNGTYAMLSRVLRRFPALELTIATQTRGYMWPKGLVEPAEEAELYRQWWLEFQHLPATLVVSTTPSWRLEAPDRRRIYEEIPNEVAYDTNPLSAVLVHRDGTIIERFTQLNRNYEQWLTELLTVLETSQSSR